MRGTKQEQADSAIIGKCGLVYVDISSKKHPHTIMVCDLADFRKWERTKEFGRIHPILGKRDSNPYAVFYKNACGSQTHIKFHSMVLPSVKIVDHIDRYSLNNSRKNLRDGSLCNSWNRRMLSNNTSGFRGVSRSTRGCGWSAFIKIGGKNKNLGTFKSAKEASIEYEKAYAEREARVFKKKGEK